MRVHPPGDRERGLCVFSLQELEDRKSSNSREPRHVSAADTKKLFDMLKEVGDLVSVCDIVEFQKLHVFWKLPVGFAQEFHIQATGPFPACV